MKNLTLCYKHGMLDKCGSHNEFSTFLGMAGFVIIFVSAIYFSI